jgi:AraC-like DNA-binding protein
MLGQFLHKPRSVIFTWSFSYVMILLVPVLIAAVTYILTVRVVEKEIINSNHYLIKRVQQQMDGLLNDAERLSQEVARDSRINDYVALRGPATAVSPYRFYQLVQILQVYKLLNPSIDDFYIYLRHLDMVISPNDFLDSKSFYRIYYNQSNITYLQWLKLISAGCGGKFAPIAYSNDDGQTIRTLAYTKSLPFLTPLVVRNNPAANIMIILDESRFMGDVKNISSLNQGKTVVLDNHNRVMASSEPDLNQQAFPDNLLQKLNEREGVMHVRLNGKRVVASFTTSQILEWKYIAIVPESVFWEKADLVRKMTFISLLFCIFIGGGLTYYSLKKNYHPMLHLIQTLEQFQGLNFDKKNNEYSFIEQVIGKVQTDLEKMDSILARQNKALREDFLTRLLLGKEGGKVPVPEGLAWHNIVFTSEFFAVMAFYIEDFSGFTAFGGPADESALRADYKQVQAIIVKVVEELIGPQNTGYMVNIDDMLICLVNLDAAEIAGGKLKLAQVARNARKLLENTLDILFLVSVSAIHQTFAGIPEAYSEAMQAMEYQKILDIREIVPYENIRELPQGSYYYPLEKERKLINFVKAGDFNGAQNIVEEVFAANFERTFLPPKIIKCLMIDMVSTMIKTVHEVNDREQADFFDGLSPVDQLLECEKVNEMKRQLLEILQKFCAYAEATSKNRNKHSDLQRVDAIKEYVAAHYHDSNMAVTSIAEYFNLHPVHLSRIFKEVSGEGLLDFINKIRIQHAKQLFGDDRNLDDVAGAVGYCSTRTFTRAFKKYEGITPGKYRNLE